MGMKPYKIKKGQKLISIHKEKRAKASAGFLDIHDEDPTFWRRCWFSDESIVTLNQFINKQNMRYWALVDPQKYAEQSHHPIKVMLFAAINSIKVSILIGLFTLLELYLWKR